MSRFGRQPDMPVEDVVHAAVAEALADAEVGRVEAAYVGTAWAPTGSAQRTLLASGIAGVPVFRHEAACASSAVAFAEAVHAVRAGRFDTVLVLGFEQMSTQVGAGIPARAHDVEGRLGRTAAALYAFAATRYLETGALSCAELASVAERNLARGAKNPRALGRRPQTVAQILASPPVAEPLTRAQCAPIADGAAALVLRRGRRGDRDVPVLACVTSSGGPWDHRSSHPWGYDLVRGVAAEAYQQAGVGVGDIDLFEVHDAFTVGEVVTAEALGLAEVWSGDSVRAHGLNLNPSGGLLSRGHPLGATGVATIAEVVWQLRGDAGARQVSGARTGLAETMGGGAAGLDGNSCAVTILGVGR